MTTTTHTATLTSDGATVLAMITDTDGTEVASFTTKDSNGFIGRLDRMFGKAGYARSGYTASNGIFTATIYARIAA